MSFSLGAVLNVDVQHYTTSALELDVVMVMII